MTLAFSLDGLRAVEFGIGRDTDNGRVFHCVPVDTHVQAALREMAAETWRALTTFGVPATYEPSEKHAAREYLTLPLLNPMASSLRALYASNNIPVDTRALDHPSQIFAYFAKFTDARGRRLTGLHRAAQFKGVLRSRNRLVRLVADTLHIVDGEIFKLDMDFDMLIDATQVYILRPAAFEFVGQLQQAVMDAVPTNIAALQTDIAFLDLSVVASYAAAHPRAARYLASICAAEETKNISKAKLKALCRRTGVSVTERAGMLHVDEGHVLGFLEVLDRRRYELELIQGLRELYRAPSRQRISGNGGGQE